MAFIIQPPELLAATLKALVFAKNPNLEAVPALDMDYLWDAIAEMVADLEVSETSVTGAVTFDCPASIVVGDPIYIDGAGEADLSRADDLTKWAWLVVAAKPTTTTCEGVRVGLVSGVPGVVLGSRYFVADAGGLSDDIASSGNALQQIGFGVGVGLLLLAVDSHPTVAP